MATLASIMLLYKTSLIDMGKRVALVLSGVGGCENYCSRPGDEGEK